MTFGVCFGVWKNPQVTDFNRICGCLGDMSIHFKHDVLIGNRWVLLSFADARLTLYAMCLFVFFYWALFRMLIDGLR